MDKFVLIPFALVCSLHFVDLNCYGVNVGIELPPEEYQYSFHNGYEGTTYYFQFKDSTHIAIQCKSNTEKYVLSDRVFSSENLKLNDRLVNRSLGQEGATNRIWIQDVYDELNLAIRIRNLKDNDREDFEKILNNLIIVKSRARKE